METSVERGAVVVGLDATPSARLALAWAADEAARRRLPLHLVIAADAPDLAGSSAELASLWTSWGPEIRAAYAPVLEEARDFAVQRHPGLRVAAELAGGSPVAVLRARVPGSSMVVIGSQHRGVVRDLLSRETVGLPLVADAPCPVVVVREPEHVTHVPPHLVVGVDGSAVSTEAVRFAFEEAAFREARLIAVSAWQPPIHGQVPADETEREAWRALSESTAGWPDKYPQVELRHEAIRGHPVQVLAEAAKYALALVAGSRGLGGFPGLLLGSVSQGLLHHAPCPLIVVPHRAG
ncbi:universal stress protein [Streptomyces sp. NBC_01381]|uniref:universal stress protein n=1 Tax=Streptomyces sp. NBC_01381 TaxID=2903845 RepID=UPI0022526065|nr:universal stress protein [Streptomyces sp. NBC_01381]MCX4673007.1 universal stress protein [Streptomyces sp. NBC_01381]